MWDPDNYPTGPIPWALLIRARWHYEVDALLTSVIVRNVGALCPEEVAQKLGATATKAVGASMEAGQKPAPDFMNYAQVLAEFDFTCGTVPKPWPFPPKSTSAYQDPMAVILGRNAMELVKLGCSQHIQKDFLKQLAVLVEAPALQMVGKR